MLGITSMFAVYTTNYVAETMEKNLTITLTSNAKGKADNLNLWFSTVLSNTNRFVDRDMIRLFCTEAMLYAKEQGDYNNTTSQLGGMIPSNQHDLDNVRNIITKLLATFNQESHFSGGGIWSADHKNLITTENYDEKISDEQKYLIDSTVNTGKPNFSTAKNSSSGLSATMSYPIFPPDYTELPKDVPVAVLLAEIPLEIPFSRTLRGLMGSESKDTPYRIFQWDVSTKEELQFLDLATGNIIPFEGWNAPAGRSMPIMKRKLPDGKSVYSLGVPVDGHNFIITHEEPAHIAENFYSNFRNFMIIFVIGAIVVSGFLLWACWWFLVGRHERKVEEDMRKLSENVSTQQQIIDSINSTLTDGVVLTDTLGNIRYSNPSFGKMVHHDEEAILGFKMGSILHPDAAEKLQNHFDNVIKSESIFDFEEKLTIKGKDVYWQGVYTPYFGQSADLSGVVAVYRDTTKMVEEREAEQARIDKLIQVLSMSVGLVNPYLRGHSQAMSELSEKLSLKLKCSKQERKTIRMAASLSQMGMISLPKQLLNKEGALTNEERATLQTHVLITSEILADFDFGLPVQETIMQMYENMDGSGYPNKLIAEQISLPARILHVTNSFCAIMRPRTYREGQTLVDALQILQKDKHLYDINVLKALIIFTSTDEGKDFVVKLQNDKL